MIKPILFLDIDGVLNASWRPHLQRGPMPDVEEWQRDAESGFDPELVWRLEYIVEKSGCILVLSSSWRKLFPLTLIERMLRYRGFKAAHLLGCTPHLTHPINGGFPRGAEIDAWLKLTGALDAGVRFAIVDDDSDMAPHTERLIQTDNRFGLRADDAVAVVEMLGRPV